VATDVETNVEVGAGVGISVEVEAKVDGIVDIADFAVGILEENDWEFGLRVDPIDVLK